MKRGIIIHKGTIQIINNLKSSIDMIKSHINLIATTYINAYLQANNVEIEKYNFSVSLCGKKFIITEIKNDVKNQSQFLEIPICNN